MIKLHTANIQTLKKAGVKIAIGSDEYDGNAKREVEYIQSLNIFSNLELLRMWSQTTVEAIYPNRKIGQLNEGYEANFLIQNGNPLSNFENTSLISLGVKQGLLSLNN